MATQYAKINKEVLKWSRENTPFSAFDVAKKLNINEKKIIEWEEGKSYPTIHQAMKLAEFYKLPFAAFYYETVPQKPIREYEDRRTFRGLKPPTLSSALWKELDNLYSIRNTILELPNVIKTSLPTIEKKDTKEDVAVKIKSFFSIDENTKYNDARKLIEKKGIIVASINKVDISEMRGVAIYFSKLPIIGINNKDENNARLFTLYHELVHILRHNSALCSVDLNENNDDEEKMCNEITAEILMPENKIRKIFINIRIDYDNVYELSKKLNVSCFALLVRLYALKIINYSDYRDIYNYCENNYIEYLKNNNKNKKYPVEYEIRYINKNGFCYVNSIINEYGSGNISFGEACLLLDVDSSYYDKIVKRSTL